MTSGREAWERSIVGWHLAFWAMWSLSVVTAAAGVAWGAVSNRPVSLALLGVLGLAYLTLGQPAARSRDRVRAWSYLSILVVSLAVLFALSPGLSFLLFLAFPQVWFLTESRREGIGFTVALAVGAGVAFVLEAGSWADGRLSFLSIAVSLVFSLLLGLWISSVIDQSAERGELLAQLAATRADLARAHHDAGVLAERERLAREIHDTIAQGLTSVVMLSQVASRHLAAGRIDAAGGTIAAIEDSARYNLADARALVASYAAVGVDDGLVAALRRLAARFERETGITVELTVDTTGHDTGSDARSDSGSDAGSNAGSDRLHEVVLLRSVQEGLANVRKHAAATRVTVTLSRHPDGRQAVEVRDDGVGFTPDGPGDGFGIEGLTRRAGEIGGQVAVTSAPGAGTVLRVEVPGG